MGVFNMHDISGMLHPLRELVSLWQYSSTFWLRNIFWVADKFKEMQIFTV